MATIEQIYNNLSSINDSYSSGIKTVYQTSGNVKSLIEEASSTVTYIGETIGSITDTGEEQWRIIKITDNGTGLVSSAIAEDGKMSYKWDDRATLTYD